MINKLKIFYRKNINPHCKNQYDSFEVAKAHCSTGYESSDLIKKVYLGTKEYLENGTGKEYMLDFEDMKFVIPLLLNNQSNIVDLGGACGAAYFMTQKIIKNLGSKYLVNSWQVVETTEMVKAAIELEDETLSFIDFEEFKKNIQFATNNTNEVLLMSSTLQYLDNLEETLRMIVGSKGFESIWVTRTPFLTDCEAEVIYSKQQSKLKNNGRPVKGTQIKNRMIEYPITFISLKSVIDIFENHGYTTLVLKENSYIAAKGRVVEYYSILATRGEYDKQ